MRGNLIWFVDDGKKKITFDNDENGEYEFLEDGRITQRKNNYANEIMKNKNDLYSPQAKQNQQKDKQPLFTTDDGMKIHEGDSYYFIYPQWIVGLCESANGVMEGALAIFWNKEKAEEYIRDNKPLFSVNDIITNSIKVTLTDKNDDVFIPKSQLIFMAKEKMKS